MDLKGQKPSKNFEDHTGRGRVGKALDYLFTNLNPVYAYRKITGPKSQGMDFRKTKPSKNFEDRTSLINSLQSYLLDPYAPWPDGSFGWDANEKNRIKKGENVKDILRDRVKSNFWENFLLGDKQKNFKANPYKNY